jgi:release factor glutamine methyltransferase
VLAEEVASRLRSAGFLAPEGDAEQLVDAALCDEELEALVLRRIEGEPVEWLVGRTTFAGVEVLVHPGVYVPRLQTVALVEHARSHVSRVAADVCCGTGALGVAIGAAYATDVDPRAVANARANGLDARVGDLLDPISETVDLVVAVPPYVPTGRLDHLPRDVRLHEPAAALDGGRDGLDIVRRLVAQVSARSDVDTLIVEVGIDEVDALAELVTAHGFEVHARIADADGDVRAVCSTRGRRSTDR